MKYYSKYSFERSKETPSVYILKAIEGKDVEGLEFNTYKTGDNAGQKFIRMTKPQSLSMRRFFANTFEVKNGPLTSTEKVNQNGRTFGDARKLGTNDLILFQFSSDREFLAMFFVKDGARSIVFKKENFGRWDDGETLVLGG